MTPEGDNDMKSDYVHQSSDELIATLRKFLEVYAARSKWQPAAGEGPHYLRRGMLLDFHPSYLVDGYAFAEEAIEMIDRFAANNRPAAEPPKEPPPEPDFCKSRPGVVVAAAAIVAIIACWIWFLLSL